MPPSPNHLLADTSSPQFLTSHNGSGAGVDLSSLSIFDEVDESTTIPLPLSSGVEGNMSTGTENDRPAAFDTHDTSPVLSVCRPLLLLSFSFCTLTLFHVGGSLSGSRCGRVREGRTTKTFVLHLMGRLLFEKAVYCFSLQLEED
jgi:hypothetical protein